jgi:glycosyltransferase involved in cell wall biosynthesis
VIDARPGVSFVVPVRNGERWLDRVLGAIQAQDDGRPFEVLAIDDGSTDGSASILRGHAAAGPVRVLDGPRRGAAAAINLGIRQARHPIICQVDQDVLVGPGWMTRLARALEAPAVAGAQGYYVTPRDSTIWARVMGLDLEYRYSLIRGTRVDHICTGNSAYRRESLQEVGLFDETLGYGYDNDMSYRLAAAGYRLVFCRDARSVHLWRDDLPSYLVQQYGVGYGRLDLVARHRRRVGGDDVSGPLMILHAPAMLGAIASLTAAGLLGLAGARWRPAAACGAGLLALLGVERLVAGMHAAIRFRAPAALGFVPVHLLRDAAWVAALTVWSIRRARRRPSRPSDSM